MRFDKFGSLSNGFVRLCVLVWVGSAAVQLQAQCDLSHVRDNWCNSGNNESFASRCALGVQLIDNLVTHPNPHIQAMRPYLAGIQSSNRAALVSAISNCQPTTRQPIGDANITSPANVLTDGVLYVVHQSINYPYSYFNTGINAVINNFATPDIYILPAFETECVPAFPDQVSNWEKLRFYTNKWDYTNILSNYDNFHFRGNNLTVVGGHFGVSVRTALVNIGQNHGQPTDLTVNMPMEAIYTNHGGATLQQIYNNVPYSLIENWVLFDYQVLANSLNGAAATNLRIVVDGPLANDQFTLADWNNSHSKYMVVVLKSNTQWVPPSVSIGTVIDGQTVDFTGVASSPTGQGIEEWEWDFGDGMSASGMNVSHTYAMGGTYDVTLTVRDERGLTGVHVLEDLLINARPMANFSWEYNPKMGLMVQFIDESFDPDGSVVAWNWDFAGLGSSSLQNPTFTFPAFFTEYPVTLTVTDNGGLTGSLTLNVYLDHGPDLEISMIDVPPVHDPDTPLEVDYRISNSGTLLAGASQVGVRVDDGQNLSCDEALEFLNPVFPIGGGAGLDQTISIDVSGRVLFRVSLYADELGQVAELDETDNCAMSAPVRIRRPDLRVDQVTLPRPRLAPGAGPSLMEVQVANAVCQPGAGWVASPTRVAFYLSTSPVAPTPSDLLEMEFTTNSIQPGASESHQVFLSVPESQPLSAYYLYALSDADDDELECDESNLFGPISVDVVTLCELADFDGNGTNILDAINLVNAIDDPSLSLSNSHFNLATSIPPLPEIIDSADVYAMLPCLLGVGDGDGAMGGFLSDFKIVASGGSYVLNLQLDGAVNSVVCLVKSPSGHVLEFNAFDVLGVGNVDVQHRSAYRVTTSNALKTAFPQPTILSNSQTWMELWADPSIDLSDLAVTAQGDYDAGVTVVVTFDDLTQQVLHKELPYVDIPDPNLRMALQEALGLDYSQPITFDQALLINSNLDLSNRGIKDLTGLRHFRYLADLNLANNLIEDAKELASIDQLGNLDLSHNQLSGIPDFSSGLVLLNLANNKIRSVPSSFVNMVSLQVLDLSQNEIREMIDLTSIYPLQVLDLSGNRLSMLPRFSTMLHTLDVSDNQISNLTSLIPLVKPTNRWVDLDLSSNIVADIWPLRFAVFESGAMVDVRFNQLGNANCTAIADIAGDGQIDLLIYPQRPYVFLNCGSSDP